MQSAEVIRSILAGVIAGLAAGFLGVSPGGILVPVISFLLPYSQHVVQGISLLAQAPPTSASGLRAYSRGRGKVAWNSVLFVSAGFIAGGPIGAVAAKICTERALRWMFVGYLLILMTLAVLKKSNATNVHSEPQDLRRSPFVILIAIGIIAGISSGLLGIGGGLAITSLSVVLLGKNQHEAQALSLAITALPLTLPAAWVYVRQGWNLPWLLIGCLVAGLVLGTWTGAGFANRLNEKTLKSAFVILLATMAAFMAVIASRSQTP